MAQIDIKPLTTLDEMRVAVELQRVFWGNDLESVTPAHMLFSLANYGGHVLAAFDNQRMVGVLIGFLGTSKNTVSAAADLQVVSKRMVVLPEYRGQGIGYRLKLEQRALAIRQGLQKISWTFDPLMALNAHLNIHKLGVVSRVYLENYYGTSNEGGLTTLGSSDRLLVEWHICEPPVEVRLGGQTPQWANGLPIVNMPEVQKSGHITSLEESYGLPDPVLKVEIPSDYPMMVRSEPELAKRWRTHTRAVFQKLFVQGYAVADFIDESVSGIRYGYYVFTRQNQA